MSKKGVNFNLGSRKLTAEEATVVERAKNLFLVSIERHRKEVAGHAVFASKSNATASATVKKAAAKPAAKSAPSGSAKWTSNKVAPSIRKY